MPLFKPLSLIGGKLVACGAGSPVRVCRPCQGEGASNAGRLIFPCTLNLTIAGMGDGTLCENCEDINATYEVDVPTGCLGAFPNQVVLNFCFGDSPLTITNIAYSLQVSTEGAGENSVCVVKFRVAVSLSDPPSFETHTFEKEIWRGTAGTPCVDVDFTDIDETLPWVSSTTDFLCFAENATVRVEAA